MRPRVCRVALTAALLAPLGAAPHVAAAAAGPAGACPKGRLCLYPEANFTGTPFVLSPPPRAAGQCASARGEFASAVNRTKTFVLTYSRPDCTIPPAPLAMCCSDGLRGGQRKDFGQRYLSVKWMRG
ncbi:MAG: peptidase inhibitor family I36 protein [Sporichthyaceae bacterium]